MPVEKLGTLVSEGAIPYPIPMDDYTSQVLFVYPSTVVCGSPPTPGPPPRIVVQQNGAYLLVVQDGFYIFNFTAVGHPSKKTYTMTFTLWDETLGRPLGPNSSVTLTVPCEKTVSPSLSCDTTVDSNNVCGPLFFQGFLRKDSRVVILLTKTGKDCPPRDSLFSVSGPISVDPAGDLALRCVQYDTERTQRFIPLFPQENSPTNEQYPPTNPPNLVYYGWSDSILPWLPSQTEDTEDIIKEPTFLSPPLPPVPPLKRINEDVYLKTDSFPYSIYFYRGVDPFTDTGFNPKLSLFTVNFDQRGVDNYRKKIYMLALTEDKFSFYEEKVNSFLYEIYASVTIFKDQRVLGQTKDRLIRFFLAMHVGYDDYPREVLDYFDQFTVLIGQTSANPLSLDLMMKGYTAVPLVDQYFQKRLVEIISNEDKSTILYWWFTAGFPSSSLLFESVHNIVAFNQYINLFYKVILDQYGTGTSVPIPQPQADGSVKLQYETKHYNFFEKFSEATTDELKLNVVREIFRLLVPNAVSDSTVQSTDPNTNDALNSHVHQWLMATNDPTYNEFKPETNYIGFETTLDEARCPFLDTNDVNVNFEISDVDHETVLQRCNPKLFPVYASPPDGPGPKYCPFGLGFRRCPGEAFNYWVIIKWMETFKDVIFEFRDEPDAPLVYIAPATAVPDNIYAIGDKSAKYPSS